jgi:hypothetical protein
LAKAKGTVVVDLVKALRRDKARARTVLAPKYHHYLEERIVIASWYPLEEYVALLKAAGQVLGRDPGGGSVYHSMGRTAARAHMQGTYSRFKDKATRQATFTLLASMYDTGEMKVVEREPGRAVWEFAGFPSPAREICETFTGYQAERMAIMGFEDVRVRHTRCRATGAQNCFWELTWKGRGAE